MQLLNKLQPLLASSPLFKDPNAAGEQSGGGKKRGNGKRRGGGRVKLGQGGTLDPLADGVLGKFFIVLLYLVDGRKGRKKYEVEFATF